MPLVSIIIPAYNCAAYLRQTIDSLLAQECAADLEIIVVNDGSSDGCDRIAREYGAPVTVVDQANGGVCVARNHGIRLARGDFMAFVDHDDYWFPHKLANQLAAFEQHPEVDVVFSELTLWFPDAASGEFPAPASFRAQAEPQGIDPEFSGWIYHRMLLECCPLTSAALVRASAVAAVGGFDESLPYSEDWDFFLKLSRISQFLKLREQTTLYRQHPTQGSRIARPIDYRSLLVEKAVAQWGLSSRDGRSVTRSQFNRQLADFHLAFALSHARNPRADSRRIALDSLRKARAVAPGNWRTWAYSLAMNLGWTAR